MSSKEVTPRISESLIDPHAIGLQQELVRHDDLSDQELEQIIGVLNAMHGWQEAEQRLNVESRTALQLNETDMKALRYIIASLHSHIPVTAGALAEHLHISSASVTKLLDRQERAGHITRRPHPTDRRAVTAEITEETQRQLHQTMGLQQARRFEIAKALTPAERNIVIRFLDAVSATMLIPAPPE